MKEVNENVAQSSSVSEEIAREIAGVSEIAGDMKNRSSQENATANDLLKLVGKLLDIVNRFKTSEEKV